MSKRQRRSSRKRMTGRMRKRRSQEPTPLVLMGPQPKFNRARRKMILKFRRQLQSQDARDASRKRRKQILVKARRVLNEMRRATRAAMKRLGGRP